METMIGPGDVRAQLTGLLHELSTEYDEANAEALRVTGDRSGDDEIDTGSKMALREHQLALLDGIRARREQVEYALRRLDEGNYGACDQCGDRIDPQRLEAFPAATSCVRCKRR
jgi:DnaK suppressor protein